jgi:hypothetical protein
MSDPPANTTSSSLRLPEFWTDRPKAWFNHLEAECDIRNPPITKMATKYHLACTGLPASVRAQVSEIMDDPPADAYTLLKQALITLYVKTPLEDGYQFLELAKLGDQLPSAHYRAMWKLWNKDGLAVFKAAYLTTLPLELLTMLTDDESPTKKLAERADKIVKNNRASAKTDSKVNAIAGPAKVNAIAGPAEVNAVNNKFNKDKNKVKDNTGVCYAHRKYGKEAYSCRGAPCPMVGITTPKPVGKDAAGR